MSFAQNTSLYCGVCFEKYSTQVLPVSFPQCGHTFCKDCTNNILKTRTPNCPFCKKCFICLGEDGYLQPPTNYALLGVIQESNIFGLCTQHHLPYEYICLQDKKFACSKCCILGEHRGHEVKEIEDVNRERDIIVKMLEGADREARIRLQKMQAELDKRHEESLQIVDAIFYNNETEKFVVKTKITQAYEKEKLHVIIYAAKNFSTERAIEKKLGQCRSMGLEEICDIGQEDIKTFINILCHNTLDYFEMLTQMTGQLNKLIVEYSSKPPGPLPDFQFSSISKRLSFSNQDDGFKSCLSFDFSGKNLTILIQKSSSALGVKNIQNWRQIEKINWIINNIWISDDDCKLLETILSHLPRVHTTDISFGPEITAPVDPASNFHFHIIHLMKILFINTRNLTSLTLSWNGADGGEIPLKYLKDEILASLNLKTLKILTPNTRVRTPISNRFGRFKSSKIFDFEGIKKLLQS